MKTDRPNTGINIWSKGTAEGMKKWYKTTVPKCEVCKKVYLVAAKARKRGTCAKCEQSLQQHYQENAEEAPE